MCMYHLLTFTSSLSLHKSSEMTRNKIKSFCEGSGPLMQLLQAKYSFRAFNPVAEETSLKSITIVIDFCSCFDCYVNISTTNRVSNTNQIVQVVSGFDDVILYIKFVYQEVWLSIASGRNCFYSSKSSLTCILLFLKQQQKKTNSSYYQA